MAKTFDPSDGMGVNTGSAATPATTTMAGADRHPPQNSVPWVNPNATTPTPSMAGADRHPPLPATAAAGIAMPAMPTYSGGQLQTFISTLKGRDLQRQNRFRVVIGSATREINMFAETVTMPGQNVRSVPDVLRHGPQREQGQGFTYGPVSIVFLASTGLPERAFFEEWQERVIVKDDWRAQYYVNYIEEIQIFALDRLENARYRVDIHEAWPKTVNAIDFSLGSNDSYQTVTVEFAFRWWESKSIAGPAASGPGAGRHPPGPTTGQMAARDYAGGDMSGEFAGTPGFGPTPSSRSPHTGFQPATSQGRPGVPH